MKVLFVSSEVVPFASSGGLGDVCAALPKALVKNNIDIIRVMPLYGCIDKKKYNISKTNISFEIKLGSFNFNALFYEQKFDDVHTYFIQSLDFFDRDGVYGESNIDYDDNFERFLFFQKATVELIDYLNLQIDIIHCNDWHTALIPLFVKYGTSGSPRISNEKTLITIHNLAHQGWFRSDKFYMTQLPLACFTPECLEFYNQINCLKGGLIESDSINTVSPTYAKEILSEQFGNQLEGVLNNRKNALFGILNGVDYERWDPQTDPYIKSNYSINDLSGKTNCKKSLQVEFNLPVKDDKPLVSMVSRLTHQKGLDLLTESINSLMDLDIQLIFLGTGDKKYEDLIKEWICKWPDKVSAQFKFSSDLAHRIFAGSDIFLMPSIFEPCGQSQIFSMKYGTIPIAYSTGGLFDTIKDYPKKGSTGFLFHNFNSVSFLEIFVYALETYYSPGKWSKIIKRAMKSSFSVEKMAKEYTDLYNKILTNL